MALDREVIINTAKKTSGMQLGGDRARELAAGPAPATTAPTYENVTGTNSTGSSNPYLDAIKAQLANNQANPYKARSFIEYTPSSTMSSAQRAALAVNGKYNAKANSLQRQQTRLDQDLAVGTATQQKYAQYGDTKLADIYGNLTNVAKETAAKTTALYDNAGTQIKDQYAQAAATQTAAANTVNADVQTTAASVGLESAVADATKDLSSYQAGAASQTAADTANSMANIITLGANMGAAALKDVEIMATLGTNTRKDLVMAVQSTISTLQYQHMQATQELQAQIADLEAARQDDLQAAQFQYEADEADRKYKYDMAKLQFDAQEHQNEISSQHQNLQDMLEVLKSEQDYADTQASIEVARKTLELNTTEKDRQYQLDVEKQKADLDKTAFDSYIKQQNLTLDYEKLSLDQKKAAQTAWKDSVDVGLRADSNETARQVASRNSAKLAEDIRHNAVTEANAAATQKAKEDAAKAKADLDATTIEKNKAQTAKTKAETDKIKAAAAKVSTTKYESGYTGAAAYAKDNKLSSTDQKAVTDAYTLALDTPDSKGSIYDIALASLLASGGSTGKGLSGTNSSSSTAAIAKKAAMLKILTSKK